MHSWTRRATRSCAHTGGAFVQNPSSSYSRPGHLSVCFTQHPSRCTMCTEVQANSAGNTAATNANRFMCPPHRLRPSADGPRAPLSKSAIVNVSSRSSAWKSSAPATPPGARPDVRRASQLTARHRAARSRVELRGEPGGPGANARQRRRNCACRARVRRRGPESRHRVRRDRTGRRSRPSAFVAPGDRLSRKVLRHVPRGFVGDGRGDVRRRRVVRRMVARLLGRGRLRLRHCGERGSGRPFRDHWWPMTAPGARGRPADAFPATSHSALAAIRGTDPQRRRRALDSLAAAYWRPVYMYLRLRWRKSHDEAADLTQEFFAHLLAKDLLDRFDP